MCVKNYENRLRVDKGIALKGCGFGPQWRQKGTSDCFNKDITKSFGVSHQEMRITEQWRTRMNVAMANPNLPGKCVAVKLVRVPL